MDTKLTTNIDPKPPILAHPVLKQYVPLQCTQLTPHCSMSDDQEGPVFAKASHSAAATHATVCADWNSLLTATSIGRCGLTKAVYTQPYESVFLLSTALNSGQAIFIVGKLWSRTLTQRQTWPCRSRSLASRKCVRRRDLHISSPPPSFLLVRKLKQGVPLPREVKRNRWRETNMQTHMGQWQRQRGDLWSIQTDY